MCVNAYYSCYYNLIQEESKKMLNENKENLKAQLIKVKDRYDEIVEKHNELVDMEK